MQNSFDDGSSTNKTTAWSAQNTSLMDITYNMYFTLFLDVQLQQITIPNARKVTGNCKGEGGFKNQSF